MAAVEVTITGMLYDRLNRTTQNVVLIGEASLTGVGVGGGPLPGGPGGVQPPGGAHPEHPIFYPPGTQPHPEHPIYYPPGSLPHPSHPIVLPGDPGWPNPPTPPTGDVLKPGEFLIIGKNEQGELKWMRFLPAPEVPPPVFGPGPKTPPKGP